MRTPSTIWVSLDRSQATAATPVRFQTQPGRGEGSTNTSDNVGHGSNGGCTRTYFGRYDGNHGGDTDGNTDNNKYGTGDRSGYDGGYGGGTSTGGFPLIDST